MIKWSLQIETDGATSDFYRFEDKIHHFLLKRWLYLVIKICTLVSRLFGSTFGVQFSKRRFIINKPLVSFLPLFLHFQLFVNLLLSLLLEWFVALQ